MKFKLVKDGQTLLIGTFPEDLIVLDDEFEEIVAQGDVELVYFDDKSYSKGYTDGYIDGERDTTAYDAEVRRRIESEDDDNDSE